jgi:hypothetical protein
MIILHILAFIALLSIGAMGGILFISLAYAGRESEESWLEEAKNNDRGTGEGKTSDTKDY